MHTSRERLHPATLPLFGELPPLGEEVESRRQQQRRAISPRSGCATGSQRHLYAATRLAKRMWRLPEGSEEQTRAGQEICRHLVACLEE